MPSAAPRPHLVETPVDSTPEPEACTSSAFDPLLVLRAACASEDHEANVATDRALASGRTIRRRGNPQQGRALEMLGHAVEYLIDSRMFQLHEGSREPESAAVQTLMRLSRSVFNDCPEVISLRTRVERLLRMR